MTDECARCGAVGGFGCYECIPEEQEPMTDQTDPAALVKALVWEGPVQWTNAGFEVDGAIRNYRAITPFGAYFIDQHGLHSRSCWRHGFIPSWESDWGRLEDAKAAAQADYEARILSALTVVDAKALVKAALERAIKRTAELQLRRTTNAYEDGYSDGAGVCYDAIRVLADDPKAVAEIVEQAKGEGDE